jgi:hypothetical protein
VEFVKKPVPEVEEEPVPGVAVPPPFNGTYGQQEPAQAGQTSQDQAEGGA